MGYWGWRPLVLGVFISTWVAGCNVVAVSNAPPESITPYPPVTLTIGRLPTATAPPSEPSISVVTVATPSFSDAHFIVRPGDTIDQIAARFGVVADAVTARNPDLRTQPLRPGARLRLPDLPPARPLGTSESRPAETPRCHLTPLMETVCIGGVEVKSRHGIAPPIVRIALLTADGWIVDQVVPELRIATPGALVPYRLVLTLPPDTPVLATQAWALPPDGAPPTDLIALASDQIAWAAIADGARVYGTVRNASPATIRVARAALILHDQAGLILGYRVIAPFARQLAPSETTVLDAEVLIARDRAAPIGGVSLLAEGIVIDGGR